MKFFTRLSPLATSILALSMAVCLAFWGFSAPTASAVEGGFWQDSGSPGACDFLNVPGSPNYICADWITQEGTQTTCCIEDSKLPGGTFTDCETVIWNLTTDERPGL